MFAVLLLAAERPRTCLRLPERADSVTQVLGLLFGCMSADVNWQAALFSSGGKFLLLRRFRFLRPDLCLQHVPVCFGVIHVGDGAAPPESIRCQIAHHLQTPGIACLHDPDSRKPLQWDSGNHGGFSFDVQPRNRDFSAGRVVVPPDKHMLQRGCGCGPEAVQRFGICIFEVPGDTPSPVTAVFQTAPPVFLLLEWLFLLCRSAIIFKRSGFVTEQILPFPSFILGFQ